MFYNEMRSPVQLSTQESHSMKKTVSQNGTMFSFFLKETQVGMSEHMSVKRVNSQENQTGQREQVCWVELMSYTRMIYQKQAEEHR